ncbi:N-acetyltransferase family protein [Maribacter sp. ANRC-HE7]|uniref:N-acetyltransferase family protein n=2 Tax=Maribacter aquimaris TaxID=2737171 RepID=A0ABR7V8C0_9FLAO|nr:N-acetyltransferase family protein [Maribacter aquimaris]
MHPADWDSVAKIYAEGIATGYATFEKSIPAFQTWDKAHLPSCRWVAVENDSILGWAALSSASSLCVYGGVAEVSIYVGTAYTGKVLGTLPMHSLIASSENEGSWTLQSGIFPENQGSIALHRKAGFRYIGIRKKIGQLEGIWKDDLLFERRSKIVGT